MANGQKESVGLFGMLPMILIAILIYNIFAFFGPSIWDVTPDLDKAGQVDEILAKGFGITMISGDVWRFSVGDGILTLGLVLLFQEVIRATSSSASSITNHALSMVIFIGAIVEFLVLPGFGTSVFFLLIMMCLFDVVAGFTVTIVSARRDFGGGGIPIVGGE